MFLLKLSEDLSIKENKISNLSVFPNPTNDFISLDFSDYNNTELYAEMFNILGQKVKVFENLNTTEILDLSELNEGVYLLKITHNGAIQTIKIKKNNNLKIRNYEKNISYIYFNAFFGICFFGSI